MDLIGATEQTRSGEASGSLWLFTIDAFARQSAGGGPTWTEATEQPRSGEALPRCHHAWPALAQRRFRPPIVNIPADRAFG